MATRFAPLAGGPRLCGRSHECSVLDTLVAHIRRGESQCLVLRGEAGIGKTALLSYLINSAPDASVLWAAGAESEMELAYASLHQLCTSLLDRLGRLPAPQREALEIVFGLRVGSAPDRFLVGLGVLGLFAGAAEERPLLCVVDDAQWLDQASVLTLAFVARRLLAEPVGMVFGAREAGTELQHLPDLDVHGVRNGDARALLDSAVRIKLDESVRDRIIAETHGNPLALLELPRGLTALQLAGGFGIPRAEALPGRIEESFVRLLERLPGRSRRLLLIAAAEPVGDPLLLWRAAERFGLGPEDADRERTQGLLAIGIRVAFRHPLVRSAVYGSAAVDERRAVHLALAEATDRAADPDRRAWHLAAAAAGPDEAVALELERSAGRAQARGGLAAAAAFLQRAVALTQDHTRRAGRALAAAEVSVPAGAFDAAQGLLAAAERGALDEFQVARVHLLRARITFPTNRGSDAPALLLGAAKELEPLDVTLARETYLEALMAAQFAGRFAAGAAGQIAQAARTARPAPSQRGHDLLLDGLAVMLTEGHAAAAPLLRRSLNTFRSGDGSEELRWLWLAEAAAIEMWDHDTWRDLAVRELQLVREAGALTMVPLALSANIVARIFAGDLAAAASLIDEVAITTEATGSQLAPYGPLILAAWRGQEPELSALSGRTLKDVATRREGLGLSTVRWANALLYNGLGQHESALAAAQEVIEPLSPKRLDATIGWALSELVEAAVRSGHPEQARAALKQLSAMTSAAGTDWAKGIEARSRALLSEAEEAERLYRGAIARLAGTNLRPELARAHLLYGEWLRRDRRRIDAREHLRQAHDMFTSIGMEAFAQRTRRELLATGETARKRTVETREELTAQEMQIAQLARDGSSNAEIGVRLFISPRTVEYHLHKAFTKLGIASRKHLDRVLPRD
jgi:DNA-binding CsgD family transcriptional regulator